MRGPPGLTPHPSLCQTDMTSPSPDSHDKSIIALCVPMTWDLLQHSPLGGPYCPLESTPCLCPPMLPHPGVYLSESRKGGQGTAPSSISRSLYVLWLLNAEWWVGLAGENFPVTGECRL